MKAKHINIIKRITDVGLLVLLLCLMAYQVTGEKAHEWVGIAMTVLVVVHQLLNIKWYTKFFKGKYNLYRILLTLINALLFASFAMTAFCGMSMSAHAVPKLYGTVKVSFARKMHLALSHWTFVFMGLHLGMHIPIITAKYKLSDKVKNIISALSCFVAGYGLYLFIRQNITDYMFFKVPFAFLDYEKAGSLVFFENILRLLFFVFIGAQLASLCRQLQKKDKEKKNPLVPLVFIMAAVILGLVINMILTKNDKKDTAKTGWGTADNTKQEEAPKKTGNMVLINGGTFRMGSPESENWRIEDETEHEVTVSSFYVDPYETTQEEYERLTGKNPSMFKGSNLPVENVTWIDAIAYANARSKSEGLTPAYTISDGKIEWDMSADGYRLPTEAEWEYACRAGTTSPFNTEKSLDAKEANFYGHYPYEIEENYFNDSVLEARPGEYRQTTVTVGSFKPNAWGLYDCHGNVNEWCWDYYDKYDLSATSDPTGAATGTRHVYRGGGWNDFAKNMRSAYRAAGQADMASYNLGIRLVRNAGDKDKRIVSAAESVPETAKGGKILIAYFSWGGNTRGIAREIQKQTDADIFEISPVKAYSEDYNTVLMEAQEDQHKQARPELKDHVDNMDRYDIILLGYPNWWASIPMPIASFLEEYDLSGKRIIPFCSHGGGRFGQSLTAIAKLAPDSDMGEGLSVHYSGGSSLSSDVYEWLSQNGIEH